jgi:hypothetical protein
MYQWTKVVVNWLIKGLIIIGLKRKAKNFDVILLAKKHFDINLREISSEQSWMCDFKGLVIYAMEVLTFVVLINFKKRKWH